MFKGKDMPILGREDILQADDIKRELVEVPEWGGTVWVKGMTGAERDRFEGSIVRVGQDGKDSKMDLSNIRAKLCSMAICDESGKKLFTQADIKELTDKSASALQRIFLVAQNLSGIGDDDIKELSEGLEDRPFEDSVSD